MEPVWRAWATLPTFYLISMLVLFITGGDALRCYECKDFSGDPCTGESVVCQPGSDVCISSLVQYDIDPSHAGSQNLQGVPTWVFLRACGNSGQCSEFVTLRTPYTRMVASNRCCVGDNCLPSKPQVFIDEPRNGLTCMGCFNVTSDTCQEYKPVECRGGESQCFTYSNQHLEGISSMAMAGCATKTACAMDLGHDGKETMCLGGSSANRSSQFLFLAAFFIVMYLI